MTIKPHQHLDTTMKQMQDAGVLALLVIANGRISGLITAYDIQGEKPVQFAQSPDCTQYPQRRHEGMEVADINATISPMRASRGKSS